MNIKTVLKSSVAVAALFAVAAPVANAADDTFKSGNKNSLTISGQVVRALWYADDGVSDEMFNTGGAETDSRVRWIASGKLNENVTVGATLETDVPVSNEQGNMTLGLQETSGTNRASDSAWGIRHQYVWVNHKKMGKLSLGNTNGASNGRAESDYSGTGIFAASSSASYGSGLSYMNTATASAPTASSVTVGESINSFDGASRDDVLRYDTPRFMGLQIAVASIAGGMWDVGADYQGKFGPLKVRVQAGFYEQSAANASTNFTASGSIAVLHDSGLNATFAIGKRNYAGEGSKTSTNASTITKGVEDPHSYYWALGYQAKLFGVGGTNFNFKWNHSYDLSQDASIDESEAQSIGFAVVQNFDAIGASIGLEYMNYSLDAKNNTVAMTFDDVDVISFMTVFKF